VQAYGGKNGLLTLKEDKHSGDQVITAINRSHELYTNYRPYRTAFSAAGAEAAAAAGGGAGNAGAGAAGQSGRDQGAGGGGELLIEELYKAGKELKPVSQWI
jgi:translation initiation factor 2D